MAMAMVFIKFRTLLLPHILCVLLISSVCAEETPGESPIELTTTAEAKTIAAKDIDVQAGSSERESSATATEERFVGHRSSRKIDPAAAKKDVAGDSGSTIKPPISLSRAIFALLAVLVLIVGGAYLLRIWNRSNGSPGRNAQISILARTNIGAKQSICLIKLGRRLLAVGISQGHMAPLVTIDDPDEIAVILGDIESKKKRSISKSFGSMIQQESQQFQKTTDDPDVLKSSTVMDDQPEEQQGQQFAQLDQADNELASLLDKVKGLGRLHYRQ